MQLSNFLYYCCTTPCFLNPHGPVLSHLWVQIPVAGWGSTPCSFLFPPVFFPNEWMIVNSYPNLSSGRASLLRVSEVCYPPPLAHPYTSRFSHRRNFRGVDMCIRSVPVSNVFDSLFKDGFHHTTRTRTNTRVVFLTVQVLGGFIKMNSCPTHDYGCTSLLSGGEVCSLPPVGTYNASCSAHRRNLHHASLHTLRTSSDDNSVAWRQRPLSVFLYHIINKRLADPTKSTSSASLAPTSEVCWRLWCSFCWLHASRFLDFSAKPGTTHCFIEVFHSSSLFRNFALANPTSSSSNASLATTSEVGGRQLSSFCWFHAMRLLDFSANSANTPCFIEVFHSSLPRRGAALVSPMKSTNNASLAPTSEVCWCLLRSFCGVHASRFSDFSAKPVNTHCFIEVFHSCLLLCRAALANPTSSASHASLASTSEVCGRLLLFLCWFHAVRVSDCSANSANAPCLVEVSHAKFPRRGATLVNPVKCTGHASLDSTSEVCCLLFLWLRWSHASRMLELPAQSISTRCCIEIPHLNSLSRRATPVNPKKSTNGASLASTSEGCESLLFSFHWLHVAWLIDPAARSVKTCRFSEVLHPNLPSSKGVLANPTKSTSKASLVSASEVCCCLLYPFCWSLDFPVKSVKIHCFTEVLHPSSLCGRAGLGLQARDYILLTSHLRYVIPLAGNTESLTAGSHFRPHVHSFDSSCPFSVFPRYDTRTVHDQALSDLLHHEPSPRTQSLNLVLCHGSKESGRLELSDFHQVNSQVSPPNTETHPGYPPDQTIPPNRCDNGRSAQQTLRLCADKRIFATWIADCFKDITFDHGGPQASLSIHGVACWHLQVDLCDCPLPLFPTSARIPTSALGSENSGNLKLVLNTQGSFIPPFPVEGQPSITAWTRSLHGL